MQKLSEKNIHFAFEVSVILKGLHALLETIGGIALLFVSQASIVHLIYSITQEELLEDPRDFIASTILRSTEHLTTGGQHFATFYLLSHGILKGFLVVNLLKEKLWAFPLAIIIFGLFILYQLFRYSLTHSVWLLLLTVLDLAVIWLTWREYQFRKAQAEASNFSS